ncbi:HNH nuclease [Jeotgalibacillus malaysiensis]|uniref:HNH nuclease n=1 Tax=Jeotgalibacillus malaysiensis TaxID=1508404 RepID=A0A0B5AQ66_9BACL|nr:hypothetical protein [Jeotgalibacillus malaysiensis]AJD90229.1 HNH nuclease [Jeotgalibacillus malaysiensis]
MIAIKINDKSIVNKHFESIKNHLVNTKNLKYNFSDLDDWIKRITRNYCGLEELIIAEPNELNVIIEKVHETGINFHTKPTSKDKNSDYEKAQYFILLYKKFSTRNDKHFVNYNALQLVISLDINVCPYCNRNFINNTKLIADSSRNHYVKRTAQLDHFYPEAQYPYIAISFYNLIPVCGACNVIKLERPIGINPYLINNTDDHLIFDYSFNNTINSYKVEPSYMSKVFEQNWGVLGLEELYSIHNDYVEDLLLRIMLYNTLYKRDLSCYLNKWAGKTNTQYENLISSEDFERIIYGNYFIESDLNKSPLAKLTKDIVGKY